jgi:hypothetical protein
LGEGNFSGFDTSVGWVTPGVGDESQRTPILATRTADGSGIIFGFFQQFVFPGDTTAYLIVATNATSYDHSGEIRLGTQLVVGGQAVNFIDGMLEPAAVSVPEPSTFVLVAAGAAGLLLARRRKTVPAA